MNTVHPIKTCLSRTFLSHVKSESPRQIPSSSVLQTRKLNHIKWLICYLYFVYNACVASSYKWICSVFLHYWNNLRNGYWKVVLIAFCDTCFNFLQPVWDSMVQFSWNWYHDISWQFGLLSASLSHIKVFFSCQVITAVGWNLLHQRKICHLHLVSGV